MRLGEGDDEQKFAPPICEWILLQMKSPFEEYF